MPRRSDRAAHGSRPLLTIDPGAVWMRCERPREVQFLGTSIPHLPAAYGTGQVLHRLDAAPVAGVGKAAQIPAVLNRGQH